MDAARYWRVVGIETYGDGDLELSALQLYGPGGRVDAAATITSSHAPTAGTLAALQDGNSATACRFAGAAVHSGGFWLGWDLGSAVAATALRPGGASQVSTFLRCCTLQYLDPTGWVTQQNLGQYTWPGAGTLDLAPSNGDPAYADVVLKLDLQGAHGSTAIADTGPGARVPLSVGNASLSNAQSPIPGGTSLLITSSGPQLRYAAGPQWYPAPGEAFTVEAYVFLPNTSGTHIVASCYQNSNNGWDFTVWDGKLAVNLSGDAYDITGGTVPAGAWHHVALSGINGAWRLFSGGVQAGPTFTGPVALASPTDLAIGGLIYAGNWYDRFNGYICGLRITKGASPRYVSDFTPPPLPLQGASGTGGQVLAPLSLRTRYVDLSVAASAVVAAHTCATPSRADWARDVEFGGAGTVYGTTKIKGTPNLPIKARVVLLHQRSKLPVRETWSDPTTGYFEFRGIDTNQQFLTLAEDAEGHFRAVAANRLTPEVLA